MANTTLWDDIGNSVDDSNNVTENNNVSVDDSPVLPRSRLRIQWPIEVQIGMAVFCGLLTFLTVAGNLTVLYSYATTKQLRTYANYFIVGLALVDLTDGSLVLPLFSVNWILGIWPFSSQLCTAYKFFSHVFGHTGYFFTLIICADRYQALSQPFKHLRRRSKMRAVSAMSIALVVSIISWIGPLIIWPLVGKNVPPQFSSLFCYPHYSRIKPFAIFANLYIAWLPLALVCIMYLQVLRILRQRSAFMQEKQSDGPKQSQQKMATVSATIERRNVQINRYYDNGAKNDMTESGVDNLGLELDDNPNPQNATNKQDHDFSRITEEMKARHKIDQQNIKATRVLTFIVVVMVVSRLPWSLLSITQIICGSRCGIPLNLFQCFFILSHMTSTLNPLCYAAGNPLFKDAFVKVLCCRWCCLDDKNNSKNGNSTTKEYTL